MFLSWFLGCKNQKKWEENLAVKCLQCIRNFWAWFRLCLFPFSASFPQQQGKESDFLRFIYIQQESTEIFVLNLLNVSRTHLNKSAVFKHAIHFLLNTTDVSVGGFNESDFRGQMPFAGRRTPPISKVNFFNSYTELTLV